MSTQGAASGIWPTAPGGGCSDSGDGDPIGEWTFAHERISDLLPFASTKSDPKTMMAPTQTM